MTQVSRTPDSRPLCLVLHGSADLYGSDRVLLSTMSAMNADTAFRLVVVLHEDGPLRNALQTAGVEVHVGNVSKIQRSMFTPVGAVRLSLQLVQTGGLLQSICAGRRVGLVYSNTLAVLGGAIWARRRRVPHLWHVHEILTRPMPVRVGLPRLAAWLSQAVISNSRQTQCWLLRQAPALSHRAQVIFNGLPAVPAPEAADVRAWRDRFGLREGELLLTVVGRLNHWKGQDLLIDALGLLVLRGGFGHLKLAVVGDVFAGHDHLRAGLVAQVQRLGLQSHVYFVPFVPDIYPVWHASDIAVVPSLEPEPFGMVAIEAMACGLPVVAAGHGGLVDIVEHEHSGLLFEPRSAPALADALARLVADPSLRRRLGAAGARRQAEHFSLQAQVAQTRALCLSLMRLA